jgi:8-oxo-dGTP diphosphatase
LTHAYPDRRVRLELWRVKRYEGDPVSRENQPLSWSFPEELLELPMLPADEPFVRRLLAAQRPNEAD